MKSCTVSTCEQPARCRGLCSVHYRRFMRHGDATKTLNRAPGEGTRHISGYWVFEIEGRSVLRHVLIAEQAIGKRLPDGAEVHHVDGDRANDANTNLVICPNRAYHQLLHLRQRALDACGHADWRKCQICQRYDAPDNLRIYESSGVVCHLACRRDQYQERKKAA